jgi:hypothetical protein
MVRSGLADVSIGTAGTTGDDAATAR